MPKYEKLTQKEKEQIVARHKQLVEKLNVYLPDNLKVKVDDKLMGKLDDPKKLAIYRIALETKAKEDKQIAAKQQFVSEHGESQKNPNPFMNSVHHGFRIENTGRNKEYNERVYEDYLHDQDALLYLRYKDLVNFDPTELYKCGDDPLKLAQFYQKHQTLCEDAYVFGRVINDCNITPQLKKSILAIQEPIHKLHVINDKVAAARGFDYFACPELTTEQVMALQVNGCDLFGMGKENDQMRAIFSDKINDANESIHQYLSKFTNDPNEFYPGYFVDNQAVKIDPYTNARKEITFSEYFAHQNEENYEIIERNEEEARKIKWISKAYSDAYMEDWKERFQERAPMFLHMNDNFDIKDFEKKLSGNIFHKIKRLFVGDSKEYSHLMRTLKNFNNPKHQDYLNQEKLREAAHAYSAKKQREHVQPYRIKELASQRFAFADAIERTCDSSRSPAVNQDVEQTLKRGYPVIGEPFVDPKEVEEIQVVENPNEEALMDVSLDNDLDMSLDE